MIALKSSFTTKAALAGSLQMAGVKRLHLRSRNVMRSMRCAVQNKGITLTWVHAMHLSARCSKPCPWRRAPSKLLEPLQTPDIDSGPSKDVLFSSDFWLKKSIFPIYFLCLSTVTCTLQAEPPFVFFFTEKGKSRLCPNRVNSLKLPQPKLLG